jgi:DNA repair protein RadC
MEYLSDTQLLMRLLRLSKRQLKGENIKEMLCNLEGHEKACLVEEICHRYGEKRINNGEPFSNSRQIFEHFKVRLSNAYQEMFITILLDNKHRILSEQIISIGTLNQSLVHPREVFAKAIELRAAAVILIHNHPSGDPRPSNQDTHITKRLCEVGKVVGIKILDHVIVGEGYYSFIDEDMMPN